MHRGRPSIRPGLSRIDAREVRPSRWLGILLLLILGLAAGAPTPTQAESTTRTISLSAGWSAVVYTGPDVAAATVAADLGADVLTVWDAAAQQYDTFYPALPAALNSLQTLASGTVVLLQLPAAGTWTMEVLPVSPVMTVQAGWNLLPWAPATALPAADVVAPLGSRLHGLYRLTAAGTFDSYLPALPAQFVTLAQVEPLDALWVSVGAGPPIPWAQVAGEDTTDTDTATDTASEAAQAVVYIESQRISGVACGSGVVISPTQVLTVAHLVADATTITLRFDDESIKTGDVTGIDTASDLAVVTVAGGVPATLTPLPWAQTNRVTVGSDLWIWGFPQCWDLNNLFVEVNPTLSQGIVSAVQTDADGSVLLQTDAALNPGNSGGPWLTPDGVVVGLTSWGLTDSEGLGFAYSLVDHQTVMDALLASDTPVVTADPVAVSNISFVASTAAFCDLSRPLGPSHNLRASDLGLCLVATYDMPAGTELRLFWTLDGTALCDETSVIIASDIRGETLLYCDPPALHSGTYALTIQHNGETVGSYSQYVTRDPVTVSNMSFVHLTADPYCLVSSPALGPSQNLLSSDLGLCLVATYDAAVGTQLDFSWTVDENTLCTYYMLVDRTMTSRTTFPYCEPASPLRSGTYTLTIQHNGETVGSYSQYIRVD
jgi:S1-C subfamily serine protease